jgi:hypothetical protein
MDRRSVRREERSDGPSLSPDANRVLTQAFRASLGTSDVTLSLVTGTWWAVVLVAGGAWLGPAIAVPVVNGAVGFVAAMGVVAGYW